MPLGRLPIARRSSRPRGGPLAPPPLGWSIRVRPSSPLELASPLGNSGVAEFRRMRVDSSADAQENHLGAKLDGAKRLRVDHTGPAYSAFFCVKDQALDNTARAESEPARCLGGGERCVQAAEVRAAHASSMARAAVVAGEAAPVFCGDRESVV